VALAEMALAGGLGADVRLSAVPREDDAACDLVLLFSESPTRFLLEVSPECLIELSDILSGLPLGQLGVVTATAPDGGAASAQLIVRGLDERVVLDAAVAGLKAAWQRPLHWS
jgi:phosphoribosylformylglycinamidine synthase subunit PurSL